MNAMTKLQKGKAILMVLLVTGLDLLFGPFLLYLLKVSGVETYSVLGASDHLPQVLLQTLVLSAYSIVLLTVFIVKYKKKFPEIFFLKVRGPVQWIWVGVLMLMLILMTGIGIQRTGDPGTILFCLGYYVLAIGFTEEFLIRGVCVHFLRDFSWQVQYLLPSFLFAMLHVFAYNGFMPLELHDLWRFMTSEMLGIVACGCCFQLVKERSGTLWVPILLHGILDFSACFL